MGITLVQHVRSSERGQFLSLNSVPWQVQSSEKGQGRPLVRQVQSSEKGPGRTLVWQVRSSENLKDHFLSLNSEEKKK